MLNIFSLNFGRYPVYKTGVCMYLFFPKADTYVSTTLAPFMLFYFYEEHVWNVKFEVMGQPF